MAITLKELARMIDFSAVSAYSSEQDVRELVDLAKKYGFMSVGVLACFVDLAKELLGDSDIILMGGAGYPSGNEKTYLKVMQARDMLASGCSELDMVINIAYLKSGRYREAMEDIKAVVDVINGTPLKVILEVAYLTDDEIKYGCDAIAEAGADFVKTGTGWAPDPTTYDHIRLIKGHVGDSLRIKAAGGIRGLDTVLTMIDLGVERFGISKNSALKIMKEAEERL